MRQQSLFDGELNDGGFSGRLIPPGCLGATFASSSLLLFKLGSLTFNLLSLMLSRLLTPVGCLGERFIFKKWAESLQALSSAVQVFYHQWHVRPVLFPTALHCFALFSLRERLFNTVKYADWLGPFT